MAKKRLSSHVKKVFESEPFFFKKSNIIVLCNDLLQTRFRVH